MTYLVRWHGFWGENLQEFDTREAAKAYAASMVILRHVKDIRIEVVKQSAGNSNNRSSK